MTKAKPVRLPGAPCVTTVILLELLPGTHAYVDLYRTSPPILVIDTGATELQLSLPGDRYTLEDLWIVDAVMEALGKFRSSLLVNLD